MVKYKNQQDLGGLITVMPEDKIPDRNGSEVRNIDLSGSGFIQTKKGYDIFGNKLTAIGSGLRGYKYVKNFGTVKKLLLRVRDDGTNSYLDWYNSANDTWELLLGSLTQGAIMGFAPANGDAATKQNLLIFCNAADNFSTWSGATGIVDSFTSNTITINENIASEGFDTSSGSIMVNGTEYAYTGTSGSQFTGVTPDPTANSMAADDGVAQVPDTSTYSSNPKGNILAVTQGKLFLSGESGNESKVHYSKTTGSGSSVTDFAITSGMASGGTFDIMEGGGEITLLEPAGKNTLIVHKNDAIIAYTRDNDGTNAIESFDTLSESEDVGASNLKAGAKINQQSYFVTITEGLKSLSKAINDPSFNLDSITDIILPTIKEYDFSEAATIYYPKKRAIFVACKESSSSVRNDKVISYYIRRGVSGGFVGDISIDDLYVADWIVSDGELYFVSSIDQNTYKMFAKYSAAGTSINHVWTSKSFTFNEPALGKEFNTIYLEGFIRYQTKIKITVLYGQFGVDGTKEKILSWDDNNNGVQTQKVSALGDEVLGTMALGATNDDIKDSYAFSTPIHIDVKKSNRYKIKIETYYDDETIAESYWAISNMATNPVLLDINNNIIKN